MAITIKATVGAVDANSFATVAEADAYLDTLYGADEWGSASADDKARLLITATNQIVKMPIVYDKLAESQALAFPVNNTSIDKETEGDGFFEAKEACIVQAFFLFLSNDTIREAINAGIQGIKSEGLSSISKTVSGYNPYRKYHPDVLKLLVNFVDFSVKTSRY